MPGAKPKRPVRPDNFRALVDNAYDGVVITGADGHYLFANQRAAEISGYTIAELIRLTLRDLTPAESQAEVEARMKKRLKGEPVPHLYDVVMLHKSGRLLPIEITVAPTQWEGEIAELVIFRDISERKAAEEALSESEQLYRSLVESTRAIAWELDLKTNLFTYVSPQAEEITGYPPDKWTDMQFWIDLLHPEDRENATNYCLSHTTAGAGHEFEYRMVAADGKVLWVRDIVSVIKENGKPVTLRGVILDLTGHMVAEEALRQSEERYRLITENTSAYSYALSYRPDGSIAVDWVGGQFEQLTGYRTDIMNDMQAWTGVIHPDDLPLIQKTAAQILSGEPGKIIYRIRTKSGAERILQDSTYPVYGADGNSIIGILGTVVDVTEREIIRQERESLIQELEAKNTELERFNYTASHDLKSPLITIKGFLDVIREEVGAGQGNEQLSVAVAQIDLAVNQMRSLLDDLLEFSRVGSMTRPKEAISLTELTADTARLLLGVRENKHIRLHMDPDLPVVFADRSLMGQVMQNLIENAIKFMGDQPHPEITVTTRENDGETVIIIRDNGVGLDLQHSSRIFDLFQQLNRSIAGTGVGLALVKRIIDLHGGRIWVESDGLGHGSSFCFTLRETP